MCRIEQARTELEVIARRLRQQYPKENENVGVTVLSLRDELSKQSRLLLLALCGAAHLHAGDRVRQSGQSVCWCVRWRDKKSFRFASRWARTGDTFCGNCFPRACILGVAGGLARSECAAAALPLLSRLVPTGLPTQEVPPVDLRMLSFALALTAITFIAFGMAPAIRVCRSAGFSGLREGVRTGGTGSHRLRSALVIAEVVVSVVLLISSGLLIRAMWKVQATDPGFRTEDILTLRTALAASEVRKDQGAGTVLYQSTDRCSQTARRD